MTQFLVRKFIKNYENTDTVKVRTAYGVLASLVGILCNVMLFLLKLIIGVLINSISIMADAFNNLSDAASSIISFCGVKLAERPADKEHPFGHGRMEYISALVVAFLILMVGLTLFLDSVKKVISPEKVGFSWIMVVILSISVLVKIWLASFNKVLGNKINSTVMKATSADARNDVFVTSATIISLIVGKYTGFTIDGLTGVFVSVFVLLSGFNIAKDTLMPLLGEAVDKDAYEDITKIVESYEGIVGSHDLILHNYGPSCIMATIHAEVANDSNIEEIHETIDRIERDILSEKGISIVIHMDPVEVSDSNVLKRRDMVEKVINEIEPDGSIHDFRVVYIGETTNLIFDLVVPYSYKEEDQQALVLKVTETVSQVDENCQCVITIENSYIAE